MLFQPQPLAPFETAQKRRKTECRKLASGVPKSASKSCLVAFRENILNNLLTLLGQVSSELSAADKSINACGACQICCTTRGLTQHNVTEMEFALLAERVSSGSSDRFREYIGRDHDLAGNFLHDVCPYYGPREGASDGCTAYEFRPFSCRVFGHIREEKTGFPTGCAFAGHEQVIKKSQYYQAVPGAARLRCLWREFQTLVALPPRHGNTSHPVFADIEGPLYLNASDPLDRTLAHIAKHRFAEALEELASLDPSVETPARTELWGLALAALDQHGLALVKYQRLLEQVPPRADFLYHAGCAAFLTGDTALAERYWKHSCQLTPLYSPSLGMLGYLSHIQQEWREAVSYFDRALLEDEDNPFFHLRLAEAHCHLGENASALPHLAIAASHPGTEEAARALQTPSATGY